MLLSSWYRFAHLLSLSYGLFWSTCNCLQSRQFSFCTSCCQNTLYLQFYIPHSSQLHFYFKSHSQAFIAKEPHYCRTFIVNICSSSQLGFFFHFRNFVCPLFNPLNAELNPICHLLALLGAHHFLHVSRIRVKSLTFRLLMSYIYDISRLRVNSLWFYRWSVVVAA